MPAAVFAPLTEVDALAGLGCSTVTADAPGQVTFARALASVSRAAASVGSLTLVTFWSNGWALPYLAFCRAVWSRSSSAARAGAALSSVATIAVDTGRTTDASRRRPALLHAQLLGSGELFLDNTWGVLPDRGTRVCRAGGPAHRWKRRRVAGYSIGTGGSSTVASRVISASESTPA